MPEGDEFVRWRECNKEHQALNTTIGDLKSDMNENTTRITSMETKMAALEVKFNDKLDEEIRKRQWKIVLFSVVFSSILPAIDLWLRYSGH